MQPSMFNVSVPLPERNEVFLMNTLTDAQLLVSPDVTDLLDRYTGDGSREAGSDEERQTLALLEENGSGANFVRAQYGAGWVSGAEVPAYRREDGDKTDHKTCFLNCSKSSFHRPFTLD